MDGESDETVDAEFLVIGTRRVLIVCRNPAAGFPDAQLACDATGDATCNATGDVAGDAARAKHRPAQAIADRLTQAAASDSSFARAAESGGPALALAALETLLPIPGALAISVGEAVTRGVPTAARATLTARTPGRPGIVEAQVGGEFAKAFAQTLDLLVVALPASSGPAVPDGGQPTLAQPQAPPAAPQSTSAETPAPPAGLQSTSAESQVSPIGPETTSAESRATSAVLRLGADSADVALQLVDDSELGEEMHDLAPRARAILDDGDAALVRGRAGDLDLAFANIASFDGPDDTSPSFVGRGGLGAAFQRVGLVAVVAQRGKVDEPTGNASELLESLVRSPRLLSRATGGTLELAGTLSVDGQTSGDLGAGGSKEKHGCRGCPTPCGWTFDTSGGTGRVGGRFSALRAAPSGSNALDFVETCNSLGMDAQAAGRLLDRSDGDSSERPVETPSDLVREGSSAFARAADYADDDSVHWSVGAHASDLAAHVGATASARGPEPLRSLSVFGLGGGDIERAIDPLPWSNGANRAHDAGVLAYFHECFAAAIDLTGFCAFSAAGLVADQVMSLDELAVVLAPGGRWPASGDPRSAMLRTGEEHVARHLRLGARSGVSADVARRAAGLTQTEPDEFADALDAFFQARAQGGFQCATRQSTTGPREKNSGEEPKGQPRAATASEQDSVSDEATSAGLHERYVMVIAGGVLGARLGPVHLRHTPGTSDAMVHVKMSPDTAFTAQEAVRALADLVPAARRWLLDGHERPIPAILRGGRAIGHETPLSPGDVLELVLVIAGG